MTSPLFAGGLSWLTFSRTWTIVSTLNTSLNTHTHSHTYINVAENIFSKDSSSSKGAGLFDDVPEEDSLFGPPSVSV